MQKIYFSWVELKSSFWFVPIIIILIAIGIAFGLIALDSYLEYRPSGIFQYIFTSSVDSARSVLSTISGAMIGVAGTVFSMTLVALTLAANQFGSRLLRNFMQVRINQVVLGIYISTYVYCLIVLNTVKDNDQLSFIPYFSVLFSILISIVNIILLIVFIHRIAISMQAENVISDIYESLSENIDNLFPEKIGEEIQEETTPDSSSIKNQYAHKKELDSTKSGYLQYVDDKALLHIAIEKDMLIELWYRPGDYLVGEMVIGAIFSKEKLQQEAIQDLQNIFIIGKVRTAQQDAEFSVHQMVEIACRALSPGVNDPYTAIACIDNLTSTLCYLTKVKFPAKYRYDEEKNLRVIAEALTYEGMLNTAFHQIRQYAAGNPSVIIRLMESLITIKKFAKNQMHHAAILKHAKMVLNVAEQSLNEKNDLKDLKKRWESIIED